MTDNGTITYIYRDQEAGLQEVIDPEVAKQTVEGRIKLRVIALGLLSTKDLANFRTMIEKGHVRVNTIEIDAGEALKAYLTEAGVYMTLLEAVIVLAKDEELALFCLSYLQAGEINNVYGSAQPCLHLAIQHEMLELTKKMVLEHGADIDARNEYGCRSICVASSFGNADMLRFLLEQYESLGRKEEILESPCGKFSLLAHAVHRGSLSATKFLVQEMGQDPLEELVFADKRKIYPHIYAAACVADVELAKWFLTEGGVPVDLVDKPQMQTVLHAICKSVIPEEKALELAKLCVEELHQTNIGLVDNWQRSAADYALERGKKLVCDYLLEAEARLQKEAAKRSAEWGSSWAAAFASIAALKEQRKAERGKGGGESEASASPLPAEVKDFLRSPVGQAGVRMLALFVRKQDAILFRELVEGGFVKVNSIDEEAEAAIFAKDLISQMTSPLGVTPLLATILAKDEEMALFCLRHLREEEIDFEYDNFGGNCLHQAAEEGMLEAVKVMVLDHGANLDAIEQLGHKAICIAAGEGHVEILRFFLDHYDKLGRKAEILEHPCDSNIFGTGPANLLVHAIFSETLPTLRYLVHELGLDPLQEQTLRSSAGPMVQTYPHQIAILFKKSEAVKWFYKEGGVPVDHVDEDNQTTGLHCVCGANDVSEKEGLVLAKFLVEEMHQKNIGLRTINGQKATDVALEKGRKVLHRYLIKAEEKVRKEEEAAKAQEAAPQAEAAAAALLRELEDEDAAKEAQEKKKAAKKAAAKKKKSGSAAGGGGGGGGGGGARSAAAAAGAVAVTATTTAMSQLDLDADAKEEGPATAVRKEEETKKDKKGTSSSPPPSQQAAPKEAAPAPPALLPPDEDWFLEGAPADLLCPISLGLMRDPVTFMDKICYERSCLVQWIEKCRSKGQPLTSPTTNAPMQEFYIESQNLKALVREWIEKREREWYATGGGGKAKGSK